MRTPPIAGLLSLPLVLLLAAGCADPDGPSGYPSGSGAGSASADLDAAVAEFERRAAAVAARWSQDPAAAVWRTALIPLQPLTVLPGQPLPEEQAQALTAGWLRGEFESGDHPLGDGEIEFADGDTEPVPLLPLAEAWAAVYTGVPDCPSPPAPAPTTPSDPDSPVSSPALCSVVTVTAAELGQVTIATNRGPAQMPAWLFTIEGVAEPLARVAIPPEHFAQPPRLTGLDRPHQPGLATAMQLTAANGRDLGYGLGVGACDEEPTPLWYETSEVIVVGGVAAPSPGVEICPDVLKVAEVTVALDHPVEARPVLATTGEVLSYGRW